VYAVQEYAFSKGPYVVTVYPDLLQAYAQGWTGFVSKLRDIQAITETALSRLSHEDLLAELSTAPVAGGNHRAVWAKRHRPDGAVIGRVLRHCAGGPKRAGLRLPDQLPAVVAPDYRRRAAHAYLRLRRDGAWLWSRAGDLRTCS
jgi:hypothetical protein